MHISKFIQHQRQIVYGNTIFISRFDRTENVLLSCPLLLFCLALHEPTAALTLKYRAHHFVELRGRLLLLVVVVVTGRGTP